MKLRTLQPLPWSILICCSLMTLLLLSACDIPGTNTTNSDSKPTPTPAPELTPYTGTGYTISYPQGWTYKQNNRQIAGHEVPTTTFTDSLGINTITIGVLPNPNGFIPTQTALSAAQELAGVNSSGKNYKQVSIEPQTTVGQQTWDQAAASGDVTQQGATVNAKAVVLACNYPAQSANTKLYIIAYGGPTATFDSADSTGFQPILKSFKFA